MTLSIELQRAARADLADAINWYNQHSPELGERLTDDVERTLARITEGPRRYPFIIGDARRIALETFPYWIFYRILDARIIVFAILHERRDPVVWRHRT